VTKPLSAGREVDAWCAKCKRISGHKIVAMMGTLPARVECIACSSVHNYKPRAPGEKIEGGAVVRRSPAGPTRSSLTKAEQARREKEQQWEKATSGKTPSQFRRYDVKQIFSEGDLLSHAKFGDGVVMRVIDAAKIEVLFRDGDSKTLAQGMA
jgi:hypothetical protein